MRSSQEERETIGKKAEDDVNKIIKEIINLYNITIVTLFENVYFEYPSVYGPLGKMSVQIDHIIITPYLIILVETKGAKFLENMDWNSFSKPKWRLYYGGSEINPVIQTQSHLTVFWNMFCKPLNIPMNKLIGVSCLTMMDKFGPSTTFTNNYILNNSNMDEGLKKLITYTDDARIDVDKLNNLIKNEIKSEEEMKDKHRKNIEHKDKIKEYFNGFKKDSKERNFMFEDYDSVRCSFCNKYMNYYIDKYDNDKMLLNCPDCFKNAKHNKLNIDSLPLNIKFRSDRWEIYGETAEDIKNKKVREMLFYLQ